MRIDANGLKAFTKSLLTEGGFTPDHAEKSADNLVWANLRGADSHGVLRISRYISMISEGKIVPTAEPKVIQQTGATALVDAGRAPGASAMIMAMNAAIDLAQSHGIGICVARDISHAGAVGYYASKAADKNMVGIVMTASGPLMAYHGSTQSALSTNPLTIAVPSEKEPIILDMSTSAAALGKVMQAKDAKTSIPDSWAIDSEGKATTDPNDVATLLPMAGAKGSGLSLMIEILCSLLAGNPVISSALTGQRGGMNGLALSIDVARFCDPKGFAEQAEQLRDVIHSLPKAPGFEEIFLPGERGFACAKERREKGIPLPAATFKKLSELAEQYNVELPYRQPEAV